MAIRSEKEKMLAGESYNIFDPELIAILIKTKELLRLYNMTESVPERQSIVEQLVGKIGQNSVIEPPFYCRYGHNIYIGDDVYLNFLCARLEEEVLYPAAVVLGEYLRCRLLPESASPATDNP